MLRFSKTRKVLTASILLALAGQANDQTGHFGAVDAADGAMPGAGTAG